MGWITHGGIVVGHVQKGAAELAPSERQQGADSGPAPAAAQVCGHLRGELAQWLNRCRQQGRLTPAKPAGKIHPVCQKAGSFTDPAPPLATSPVPQFATGLVPQFATGLVRQFATGLVRLLKN